MAIVLGALILNPNLIWSDRDQYTPVVQEVKVTLGGGPIIYSGSITANRNITLVATTDQGWVSEDQRAALVSMSQAVGSEFTLTVGFENFKVMFRHQEPPALDLIPLITRAVALPGDYFYGSVKLFTV